MIRIVTVAEVRAARAQAHDAIDAAYWRFCRCQKAPPPVVAEPKAYAIRNRCDAVLRWVRR